MWPELNQKYINLYYMITRILLLLIQLPPILLVTITSTTYPLFPLDRNNVCFVNWIIDSSSESLHLFKSPCFCFSNSNSSILMQYLLLCNTWNCIYKWKVILTFSCAYAVVYGDLLLFPPVSSRQRAVVVRGFVAVQQRMIWKEKPAHLIGSFSEQRPVWCHKFTDEGWRAWTLCIIAVQPWMD